MASKCDSSGSDDSNDSIDRSIRFAGRDSTSEQTRGNSKYKDMISQSLLIKSGSPAVYQLKPNKTTCENLTRMTVGKRNVEKINKTVLLVGETGSGKSTLINTLVNYVMGVKWEDNVWFQITGEENSSGNNDELQSDTSDVVVYDIFGFEGQTVPYSLTLIDTPGYGDTRGIEYDDVISLRLLQWFQSHSGVYEINAVGLVLQESLPRLTDRMLYIFDSLISLFGKDLGGTIVALITNSHGRKPAKVLTALKKTKIKCATNQSNEPVYFQFDNCQKDDRTEDTDSLKYSEDITQKGLTGFTTFLKDMAPQNLKKTVDVLVNRVALAACIQNLQERIGEIETKQTAIQQNQKALEMYEEKKKNNENYIEEYDEVYKEEEPFEDGGMWGFFYHGVTRCTVCKENCHRDGCTMAWKPAHCKVMKNGKCTSCTNKCPVSAHVKDAMYYEVKTRTVQRTKEEMKRAYDEHSRRAEDQLSFLETLINEMAVLTEKRSQLLEEAYQLVMKLSEIALNDNSGFTLVHLDFLIEKMTEKGETEKVHKLQEINSRKDPQEKNALMWYLKKPVNIVKFVAQKLGISQTVPGTDV